MADLENSAEAALHSAPELDKEQVTHVDDTSKELLYGGSNDNNNKNKKIDIHNDSSEPI